jgi:hypothetical protein
MRHLLLAALTALFTATAAPAFAASMFDFLFSGTVASDTSFGPPLPLVFGQNLTGKPFHVSESVNLANAFLNGNNVYVGGPNFVSAEITIGNVSAPIKGEAVFSPAAPVGGLFSSVFANGTGRTTLGNGFAALLDFESLFDPSQNNGYEAAAGLSLFGPRATFRTIDFNIASETLVLAPASPVSPVPLPPALPMFAFALLALGISGYVRRAKDVTPAHGQAC